ncbi:glucose-6-phosphate isomerase [Halobacteriovorax sp. HLS]|uniref:glucose-6-phosphate isomerase n=1 Tax=Halobacteriovorax sp. HLS TaxID=2234000 RepID=UPI000FD936D3|nr:glucose-6-phosphate isomerase [Halobacteriovorax sp. HLS]
MKIERVSPFEKEENLFATDFLKSKLVAFKEIINDPSSGFFHLPKNEELLQSSIELHKKFAHITEFVHVGIGGSSLGPEMLISALSKNKTNFTFINNIDPERISDQLEKVNIENALFYFVSKSGGTAELTAGMSIIINWLEEKGLSQDQWSKKFVFCTDPEKSILLDLGKQLDIPTLSIPSNIGGRFSVLTPVGMFPALFAGIDIKQLMQGASKACQYCLDENVENNPLLNTASYLYDLKNFEINQTVFMPYSSKLRDFCFWFVQLWAESLGKKNDLQGEEIFTGLTPIPGYGATDQHSQMQLFMEGPLDKCLLLLEVENFNTDYKLNSSIDFPSFKKLNNHSLVELMKAELYGTIMALKEMGRPFIHFKIDQNDAASMGELIIFFESLTALMGNYLNINPFDQPGVELGKVYAYQKLEKN